MKSIEEVIEVLSNKTVDAQAVDKALQYASVRNFNTLHQIQSSISGVKRYDVPIQDMERLTRLPKENDSRHFPHRYGYLIADNFVSIDKRYRVKNSGYYGVPVSQETISANPDIFDYNFIMFIGGYFVDTGEMILYDDKAYIVLDVNPGEDSTNPIMTDGIPVAEFKAYWEKNNTVTIFTVPNYKFDKASTTLNMFNWLNYKIPKSYFNTDAAFTKDTLFFINNTSDVALRRLTKTEIVDDGILVDNTIDYTNSTIGISAITMNGIYDTRVIEADDIKWFQLDDGYTTPVPVTQMLPFVLRDGVMMFENNISIEMYYPNIYHVVGHEPEDVIYIYIFYRESNDSEYRNHLELLRLLSGNLLERYDTSSLPDFVKEYYPQDVNWLDDKLYYNDVMSETGVRFPTRSMYDVAALSEYILKDSDILLKYLYLKLQAMPSYYVNVSKLNLPGLVRNDTYLECSDTGDIYAFDEPRYVFGLRKTLAGTFGLDFRIFIDNEFLSPARYTFIRGNDSFFYWYIPTKYVKEDSIIEIEKFTEYEFRETLVFTNPATVHKVTLPNHTPRIFARDITVIDTETSRFLKPEEFIVTAYNSIADDEIELDVEGYSSIKSYFNIKLADTSVLYGKELLVLVHHRLITKILKYNEEDYGVPASVDIDNFNAVTYDRVRAYRDGVKIPYDACDLWDNDEYMKPAKFSIFFDVADSVYKHGECVINIDELPAELRREYYSPQIDNEYGFVDTGNSLSMPFDLKWYEVYVNGRKLHKYNVDVITTNKFFIKGINSLKNVEIYARQDAYCEFTFFHEDYIENKLFANIDEIYDALIKDRDIIEDTLEDITEDLLINIGRHHRFVKEILEYTFINPNIQQITEKIRKLYPEFIDEYGILWLEVNRWAQASYITLIDSNVRGEEMKNDQYRYGFTPLYIGSHEDAKDGEYLVDPVTGAPGMKTKKGLVLATGALDRLNVHKAAFNTALVNNNLSYLDIYHVEREDSKVTYEVKDGDNLLGDEPLEINSVIKNALISIDMDILEAGSMNVAYHSAYSPYVVIGYVKDEDTKVTELRLPIKYMNDNPIAFNCNKLEIKYMTLEPEGAIGMDDQGIECILHSILIAF